MNIKTKRLTIREFKDEDWGEIYEYTSNEETMRYIPEDVFSRDGARKFISKNKGKDARNFPVVLNSDNKIIGHIYFEKYFGDHTYEIGWVFNSKYHSKGYGTEAAYNVLKYGFEELKLHRIVATCQPENTPSWKVMEKIGMRKEGYFKKCIPFGDGWWDEFYYGILEEEWENI